MNDADADRVRTILGKTWKPDMRCASCAFPPTCPQLYDELWMKVWVKFLTMHEAGHMQMRMLRCSDRRCDELHESRHTGRCEMTTQRPRQLLCLECAEKVLSRELSLDDLYPCMGNYAHYVMQQRVSDRAGAPVVIRTKPLTVEEAERIQQYLNSQPQRALILDSEPNLEQRVKAIEEEHPQWSAAEVLSWLVYGRLP